MLSQEFLERLSNPLARHVELRAALGSTMARARELARAGAPHGTLVISEVQTGGVGRRGRSWVSPAGGVWMSLVLRPELEIEHASRLTQAAAVGVAKALHDIGVRARIKWPNDLLVKGRKICGILASGASPVAKHAASMHSPGFVILGIGLNANLDPGDLGVPVEQATTIRSVLGKDVDLNRLIESLLSHLDRELRRVNDFEAVLKDWRELDCTLGKRVRVETTGEFLEGLALDLTPEGALRVETEKGVVELFEGNVEYLRL